MRLWRIARRRYADLSGAGAKRLGGRWNSPGSAVVYTAADPALAALEVRVHLDLPFDQLPPDYLLIEIESGRAAIETAAERIEPDLRRSFGDAWLAERRTPLLRVPSVIVPESANVLVNPAHPGAAAVSIVGTRPWRFDERLF